MDADISKWIFLSNEAGFHEINERRGAIAIKKFPSHRATLITLSFLMNSTRKSELEYEYLVELK